MKHADKFSTLGEKKYNIEKENLENRYDLYLKKITEKRFLWHVIPGRSGRV